MFDVAQVGSWPRRRDNGAFGPQDIHGRMHYSGFVHDPHGINDAAVWLRSE